MLDNLINSPFLTSLALTLLHFLWQGLLVATTLKSVLLVFNNNKPQIRYALSSLAMLVSLLLPIITFIIVYRTELLSVNADANLLLLNELTQESKQPDAFFSYKGLTEYIPTLLPYLSILWLTTITLLAGKLLIEISIVNKLPKQGALTPSDELQERFNQLIKQIHLTVTPRLIISLKVEVPMAIGWLKPVVLLPAKMITGLSSAQLEMLILHELAHIRRHDYLVNFLQTLVETLLFFHPAVLWISKQMRNEREYCSDDIAVQHCGDAVAYAHTLADTASLCTKSHNHTIPDMAMAASGGDLKQRVVRLVDHHCTPKNNISKWFASATIVFSVVLLSSKQLLTIPLLDTLHNKSPWNPYKNGVTNTEKMQKNSLVFNKKFANDPITKQLLTPQNNEQAKQALLVEKIQPTIAEANVITSKKNTAKTVSKIEAAKYNQPLSENQPIIINETKQFTEKLDRLSTNSSQTKEVIDTNIIHNSIMVEEAFSRTNSSNPYQKELAQLAAPASQKAIITEEAIEKVNIMQQKKSVRNNNYNQFDNNKVKTTRLANIELDETKNIKFATHDFSNKVVFDKKKFTPIKPIWQNAEQLKSVAPIYPSIAKRKGIEIEVTVNFTIDVDGQIKNIKFPHQNRINYFKNSIRSAIKKWQFLPAKVDDQPVESQMFKVFAFSLHS